MNNILEKIIYLRKIYSEDKIEKLHSHEVNPNLDKGSRLNYLYFTLPVSLNFQRSSPSMWKAALETFNDPDTNYLFYPEKVITKSREEVQRDLIKHKLGLQKNKHTDIWIKLCETFNKYFDNDPRNLLKKYNYDVIKIINFIRIEKKKDFPYLSGAKMANYWLYILHNFTDAQFSNLDYISIIPDTHVMQCSIQLGIIDKVSSPQIVAEKWFEILKDSGISPIEMHPILWNWSRAGFLPEVKS